jgi:transposase
MDRSIKVSLGLATDAKKRRIDALLREARSCTQRYIDSLWRNPGQLDAKTLNRIPGGSLSYRHRSNCLKVALETISSTKKAEAETGKKAGKPRIKGAICLSSLVAKIEPGKGSFDFVLKVSGLVKGEPVVVPFKAHKRLNHWLKKLGAKLLQGCTLGDGWAALWIRVPDAKPSRERILNGKVLAVDIGKNKLLVDSDGAVYGPETKSVCDRVRRCKPGSKGRLRANRARENYINREVKKIPWSEISVIGREDLKNLKRGKKKGRGKNFRKAMAPWTYRQAVKRIDMLAEENRVLVVAYDPRNTSRQCPRCGWVAKENRKGESFRCVQCHCSADADFVGALNGLARTFGKLGAVYGRPAPSGQAS